MRGYFYLEADTTMASEMRDTWNKFESLGRSLNLGVLFQAGQGLGML